MDGRTHKRYVYGTRTKRWYLVGKSDRDYDFGISPNDFHRLGEEASRELYLERSFLGR